MHGVLWQWVVLFALGAFHGINPGMGWLFAVALGMQESRRHGVFRALAPLALGHVLSVGAIVLVAIALGVVVPLRYVEWLAVVVLLGFGIAKLVRSRHPRWVGMRVGMKDLTLWSFLMASAHGAGLMVLPVVFSMSHVAHAAGELDHQVECMQTDRGHGAGRRLVGIGAPVFRRDKSRGTSGVLRHHAHDPAQPSVAQPLAHFPE